MIKKFFMFTLIFLSIPLLSSCKSKNIKYVDYDWQFSVKTPYSFGPVIITTEQEMKSTFENVEYYWVNDKSIFDIYNKRYFKNKDLIVFQYWISGCPEIVISLDKIEISDNTLIVVLNMEGSVASNAVLTRHFFLEMKKGIYKPDMGIDIFFKIK
ncbi:MAG: hypothetical protein ACOX56_00310 [Acholeplasmataceae bacterium]|jgi:hypothetical protein